MWYENRGFRARFIRVISLSSCCVLSLMAMAGGISEHMLTSLSILKWVDGRKRVWRQCRERHVLESSLSRWQSHGVGQDFSGCKDRMVFIEGNLNAQPYISKVLAIRLEWNSTLNDLQRFLREEWARIPQQTIWKLVYSSKNRVRECQQNNCSYTHCWTLLTFGTLFWKTPVGFRDADRISVLLLNEIFIYSNQE